MNNNQLMKYVSIHTLQLVGVYTATWPEVQSIEVQKLCDMFSEVCGVVGTRLERTPLSTTAFERTRVVQSGCTTHCTVQNSQFTDNYKYLSTKYSMSS